MKIDVLALKPLQKAIIKIIYHTQESLSGDEIFVLLHQANVNSSYATVFNNLRVLRENQMLITDSPLNKKTASQYQLSKSLQIQLERCENRAAKNN